MRKIKKMMAIAMLAVVASLGTGTANATTGIYLSDRQINTGDTKEVTAPDMIDILVVYLKTGIYLSDRQGVLLSD